MSQNVGRRDSKLQFPNLYKLQLCKLLGTDVMVHFVFFTNLRYIER